MSKDMRQDDPTMSRPASPKGSSGSGSDSTTERASTGPGASGLQATSSWSIVAFPQTPQLDVA